ncbi:TPA: hypothetical protein PPD39_003568 [Acinetobacter baumannii]|nr:hypothetical protein [Acinetobacter baumannii]ELA9167468.1 hypothetical protein [Acinetobacter baumannii]EME4724532.1 hypothetical protein [Acinetobacter baumannii]MBD0077121.1 hypothetical protein [Acinetobacter baumannii]MBP4313821.1 hypothetical protein [Acinetobacter baumannii]MBP4677135.1 hypothetical protein [Acinetobacter baumannii]
MSESCCGKLGLKLVALRQLSLLVGVDALLSPVDLPLPKLVPPDKLTVVASY